jgi:hypothetical protein
MTDKSKNRWDLINVNVNGSYFVVLDKVSGRERMHFVPGLETAEVRDDLAYISTSSSKFILLNLRSLHRKFINETDFSKDAASKKNKV